MHSTVTGRFITSDYYMEDYPAWWKAFYEGKPQDKYFGKSWDPLLPEEAYARSTSDDRPWTTRYKGLGSRFPHATTGGATKPDKAYYDAMMWTPWGDLLTLDFVKAAIEGENLGNNPAGAARHSGDQLDQPRLRQPPVRPGKPPVARPDRAA